MGAKGKGFFAKHAKSSAAMVSLGIHVVLLVGALAFVAVRVIQKDDQNFEAVPVNRPKMQLKKLQVPVNVKKKKTQKPKLRKRIVVKPKMKSVPDIKMPEITGVKGGLGSAGGDGLGGGGGVGFSMPQIKILGVKSKGEKVFIVLDSSPWMMYDEIGGIKGYKVIKDELVKIIGGLSPTVLFNIAVYDRGRAVTRFERLVPASTANVEKVEEWLTPLNAAKGGDSQYGLHTLGSGSVRMENELPAKPIQRTSDWSTPTMLAMQQQADSIFILTQGWGWQHHVVSAAEQWSEAQKAKYAATKKKAYQMLKEENDRRKAKGQEPRVLVGHSVINTYCPGTQHPPQPKRYNYTPKEMVEAFINQRQAHTPKILATTSGVRKKKQKFSINVIHFIRKDKIDQRVQEKFKQIANYANGEYKTLMGFDAIQSAAE